MLYGRWNLCRLFHITTNVISTYVIDKSLLQGKAQEAQVSFSKNDTYLKQGKIEYK